MNNKIDFYETDILVIGGGSAGCMAAIAASDADPNLKVTIIEKANIRRSGTLATGMDALNIVAVPGVATPEQYVKNADLDHNRGIMDKNLHYLLAEKSYAMLKKLEKWGVEFEKDEKGQYVTNELFYGPYDGKFLIPMKGLELKLTLSREVKKRNIETLNHTMTTSLLSDYNKIYGACGFNIRTGKIFVYTAKAVILTVGGCGRFGLPSSGYMYGSFDFPGNAGDGYSMAYRAGAELRNFEYVQNFREISKLNVPLGKEYEYFNFKRFDENGNELKGSYHHQGSDAAKMPLYHGKIYEDYSQLTEEERNKVMQIWLESERKHPIKSFFKERNIDLKRDLIEYGYEDIALCSGHGSSGIKVDTNTATSLQGLYAAGDVACVPCQYLTGAFVYGEIAGLAAADYSRSCHNNPKYQDTCREQIESIISITKRSEGVNPRDFELKLRKIITEYLSPPRTETKLKTALKWIRRFREEDVHQLKTDDFHELGKAVEAEFILDCSEMVARSALERKESRWGMSDYRTDFPERDDENWLKFVDLKINPDSKEMVVFTSPIN